MAEYKGLNAILEHFREMLIPAGTVILYAGSTLPPRYLLCNGDRVLKTYYPELWEAIGHTWAISTDTAAMKVDYFRLPDLRECVAVGAGVPPYSTYRNTTRVFDSTEVDPRTGTNGRQSHDAYLLGDFRDDQFQGHEHDYQHQDYTGNVAAGSGGVEMKNAVTNGIANKSGYGNVRYGTTTHGKQVGLYYIIKF